MNILSLFDGMSCGITALKKVGLPIDNYFASEIDKYAIEVSKTNHPEIQHIGDVSKINTSELPKIDLLIGGSPCQGFSFAGKQLNFNDPRSSLFFEFVRIKNELNPKYFLLENVRMKKEYEGIISEQLGCQPVRINTHNFLPINRDRLYWTNIPINSIIPKHKDPISFLGLSSEFKPATVGSSSNRIIKETKYFGALTASIYKGIRAAGRPIVAHNSVLNKHIDEVPKELYRGLTVKECELLQGIPLGYTDCVSKTQAYKMLGNGWTIDVIEHIFKGLK